MSGMPMLKRFRHLRDQSIAWAFLAPYVLLFTLFIIIPVLIAIALSFTNFNTIQAPDLVGFMNYVNLLTRDAIFMQYVPVCGDRGAGRIPAVVLPGLVLEPDFQGTAHDPGAAAVQPVDDQRRGDDGCLEDHLLGR